MHLPDPGRMGRRNLMLAVIMVRLSRVGRKGSGHALPIRTFGRLDRLLQQRRAVFRYGVVAVLVLIAQEPAHPQIQAKRPVAIRDIDIVPVGRWVSKSGKRWLLQRSEFQDYGHYVEKMRNGTFQYDDTFRDPKNSEGPTIVHCGRVRRIGLTVGLTKASARRVYRRSVPFRLDFRWAHSSLELKGNQFEQRKRGRKGFYSSGITLDDEGLIDGTYTVNVLYKGTPLYENAFRLVGCDRTRYDCKYPTAQSIKE